jgi:hypothetical protein
MKRRDFIAISSGMDASSIAKAAGTPSTAIQPTAEALQCRDIERSRIRRLARFAISLASSDREHGIEKVECPLLLLLLPGTPKTGCGDLRSGECAGSGDPRTTEMERAS